MKTNRLSQESSPYLLQHSHNPVDWFPWGEEALTKAQTEDKPILVSIGYSACHWCHVMERESFENQQIADIMNKHFVCIKIDREERPDVDAVYMDAIQAMGLRGGWPLNVFLMPDTKPFYGGTYFPPQKWANILLGVQDAFINKRADLQNSANGFTDELIRNQEFGIENEKIMPNFSFQMPDLYESLSKNFDTIKGGMNRSPKFPMPCIWKFLLRYYALSKDKNALNQLKTTLDRIALGGIYDQLGGGWTRYSTDENWMVPHFEKMLYDNGQLVSLYSEMYQLTKDELYKQSVYQTIEWLEREMTHEEGGFYAALDADSEGEEGKFYCWKLTEIEEILENDAPWFAELYDISQAGNWEHGNNILHTEFRVNEYFDELGWDKKYAEKKLTEAHQKLFSAREKRVRPSLDDKIICSWNGLMLKGLIDAYRVFNEEKFLILALKNAHFITEKMTLEVVKEDGQKGKGLWHTYKNGKATLTAYLEDYASIIDAYISLYQATFEEKWLEEAQFLTDYTIANFYDFDNDFFFFTDINGEKLIARKKEIFDNVIPASNSIMAGNLYFLGILLDNLSYSEIAEKMVQKMQPYIISQTEWVSNWACMATYFAKPTAEIALVGNKINEIRQQLEQDFNPNRLFLGTKTISSLPLLENKTTTGETMIYVCFDKTCQLPTTDIEVAKGLLK